MQRAADTNATFFTTSTQVLWQLRKWLHRAALATHSSSAVQHEDVAQMLALDPINTVHFHMECGRSTCATISAGAQMGGRWHAMTAELTVTQQHQEQQE